MRIVPLTPEYEPAFWLRVNQDLFHYFFFAFDWKNSREKTTIFLAIEQHQIAGMMLVYADRIIHLRGSSQAVTALLDTIDLDDVELHAPPQYTAHVLTKFSPTTLSTEIMVMTLHQEHVPPHIKHPIVTLGVKDAERIAVLMNEADPLIWGDVTRQRIEERMKDMTWIGLKINNQLVALSSYRITEWTGWVSVTATDKAHRNKGYATSLVSYAVQQSLKKKSAIMIFVRTDNPSALHVYHKVGFQPYRTYFFMRGKKIPIISKPYLNENRNTNGKR